MADSDQASLGQERTDLAEDRTILAHERSFAGWLRTGMASVGIGLGFNALFQSLQPVWVPKAIASLFLGIAILSFVSAERRACAILTRLESHQVRSLRPIRIRLIAWTLTGATIALGTSFWLLA